MRRILLGKLVGRTVHVEKLDGTQIGGPLLFGDVLLMSRSDCSVLVFPLVRSLWWRWTVDRQVNSALRQRYPGRLDEVVYDTAFKRRGKRVAVIVAVLPRQAAELYLNRAGSARLELTCALVNPSRLRDRKRLEGKQCLTFDDGKAEEAMIFEDGLLCSSEVVGSQGSGALAAEVEEPCLRLRRPSLKTNETRVVASRNSVSLGSVLSRPSRCGGLFESERPVRSRVLAIRRLLPLLLLLIAGNLLLSLTGHTSVFERGKSSSPESASMQDKREASDAENAEIESIRTRLSRLVSARPVSLYHVMGEVQNASHAGVRLQTLHMEDGILDLSLFCPSPMEFLSRFAESPLFSEVALTGIRQSNEAPLMRLSLRARLR